MKAYGSAVWQGGLKDGRGAISTRSGALKDYPYGFSSRFEGKPGTNPEELIGAAHAACFTMALSLILSEAKLTVERMEHDRGGYTQQCWGTQESSIGFIVIFAFSSLETGHPALALPASSSSIF